MATETLMVGAAICAAFGLVSLQRWLLVSQVGASVKLKARAHDVLHPYRPELHYMRGPGPKWLEKHGGRYE
jgi:hypothetical protein